MALVKRTISNAGAPLCTPDGAVLSGVKVTFTLRGYGTVRDDVWDATTLERVAGEAVAVITDANGEFAVGLWPNSRGNRATRYLCQVGHEGVRDFSGVIEDAPTTLSWIAFMAAGVPLTPQEISQLSLYLAQIEQAKDDAEQAAADAAGAAGAAITAHVAEADPHTQYLKEADLPASLPPSGGAGGVLSGNYPNPGFAVDMATQTELDNAIATREPTIAAGTAAQYRRGDKTWQTLNKAAVGLGNADNTADSAKPVSTAQAAAIATATAIHPFLLIGA